MVKEVNELTNDQSDLEWILFVDGAANMRGTGLGIVLKSPQGDKLVQAKSCAFEATNNEAEYEALIVGLKACIDLGVQNLKVRTDSLLISNQVNGVYTAKDSKMILYLEIVQKLKEKFINFNITQIPRDLNTQADALASLGSNFNPPDYQSIPIIHLLESSITRQTESFPIYVSNSWTKPYYDWLVRGILPHNKQDAKALQIKAASYTIINNVLYKKSQAGPYLRCLEPQEAQEVLSEIHEGYCGNHKGGRSLASKILRTGYYWPTLRADCQEFSSKCKACQIHAPYIHQPSEELHSISAPWPFMKWGMDIVGKLPQAPGQKVFMLAMTDYFSKWIEADSYREVKEKDVISFINKKSFADMGSQQK